MEGYLIKFSDDHFQLTADHIPFEGYIHKVKTKRLQKFLIDMKISQQVIVENFQDNNQEFLKLTEDGGDTIIIPIESSDDIITTESDDDPYGLDISNSIAWLGHGISKYLDMNESECESECESKCKSECESDWESDCE